MQIVASADIGEVGPTDGKPVPYHFHRLYHAQGFIPWLLLPLAFVALKENRTVQAAWILAPIALLAAVCWAVMMVLKLTSGDTVQMNMLFTIMIVGFAMVWLFAERIGNRNRFVTFLLAALVYLGFLGISLLSHGLAGDVLAISLLAAVSILPILFAFAIAALISSKSFSRVRFIAGMGAALFGSLLLICSAIMLILQPSPNLSINRQIVEVLRVSFFIGLLCFACLLPFLVVLFASPFWRRRFECVTGIRTNIR